MQIVGDTGDDDVAAIIEALQGTSAATGQSPSGEKILDAKKLPIAFAGMTVTSLATTLTGNIAVPINVAMRIDRVVMGQAACVALSRITQISIGSINLLVGTQPIPCEVFRYDAVATTIKAPLVATPSVPPVVSVSNQTAGTVVYEGAIMGPVARAG